MDKESVLHAMTNAELQAAIDALLKHFSTRRGWCEGGSPDGALAECLAKMIYVQATRAALSMPVIREPQNG